MAFPSSLPPGLRTPVTQARPCNPGGPARLPPGVHRSEELELLGENMEPWPGLGIAAVGEAKSADPGVHARAPAASVTPSSVP